MGEFTRDQDTKGFSGSTGKENDVVELNRIDDNILIKKIQPEKELTLDDIFRDYNGAFAAEEFNWGGPAGKEVW